MDAPPSPLLRSATGVVQLPPDQPLDGDEFSGWLLKWTNYMSGWRERWFIVRGGALSYYRSKEEITETCRGTVNLIGAHISVEDRCGLDVSTSTQHFHLRAHSEAERARWVTALELSKQRALNRAKHHDKHSLQSRIPSSSNSASASTALASSPALSLAGANPRAQQAAYHSSANTILTSAAAHHDPSQLTQMSFSSSTASASSAGGSLSRNRTVGVVGQDDFDSENEEEEEEDASETVFNESLFLTSAHDYLSELKICNDLVGKRSTVLQKTCTLVEESLSLVSLPGNDADSPPASSSSLGSSTSLSSSSPAPSTAATPSGLLAPPSLKPSPSAPLASSASASPLLPTAATATISPSASGYYAASSSSSSSPASSNASAAANLRQLQEEAIMFKMTATAMVEAAAKITQFIEEQHGNWSKLLHAERMRREKLDETVEALAKQHNVLERRATMAALGRPMQTQVEIDDDEFFDAAEEEFQDASSDDFHVAPESSSSSSAAAAAAAAGPAASSANPLSPGKSSSSSLQLQLAPRKRRDRIPFRPQKNYSLWGVMKNCIGKDLAKIPMPVFFNEPLSFLQRLCEDLEYSELLDIAAKLPSSVDRMAYVAAFTMSSYANTTTRTGKPFNPILGETYELDMRPEKGWRVITEQVSHHPPVSAMHTEGRGWRLWQDFGMKSKFRGKYLQIVPVGITHLVFDATGDHYTWRKVTTTVHNIIVGKLWIDQHGEMEILNHTSKEKCTMKYYAYSYFSSEKPRKVTGEIFDAQGTLKAELLGTWDESVEVRPPGTDPSFIGKQLWHRTPLPADSAKMYGYTTFACLLNELEPGVAPTDSRLRPDQRLMEEGNWDEANNEKLRLEEKQRTVRRQRELDNEPYSARWFERRYEKLSDTEEFIYRGGYWESKEKQAWENVADIF